jgi:hypothetical protein
MKNKMAILQLFGAFPSSLLGIRQLAINKPSLYIEFTRFVNSFVGASHASEGFVILRVWLALAD